MREDESTALKCFNCLILSFLIREITFSISSNQCTLYSRGHVYCLPICSCEYGISKKHANIPLFANDTEIDILTTLKNILRRAPPLDQFLDTRLPEVIFDSHIMFINTSTKEFTHVNNAFPSHDVAYEHLLYYKMVANVY